MALSEIEKLERRYAENPQGLTFAPLAEVHRKNGDVARALELLRPGLTLHPDYIPASIVLGRCHLDLGELPAAEAAFNHVLSLDGENVIALKALADIAERMFRFDEAERLLGALLAVDRTNDEARDQLGRVEAARQQAEAGGPGVASEVPVPATEPVATSAEEGQDRPTEEPAVLAEPAPDEAAPVEVPEAAAAALGDEAAPLDLMEPEPTEAGPAEPPPEGIMLEQPVTVEEEEIEPLAGLVGREEDAAEPPAADWDGDFRVETAEDIVLESSGGGEFQMANAAEELLVERVYSPEPEPVLPVEEAAPGEEAGPVEAAVSEALVDEEPAPAEPVLAESVAAGPVADEPAMAPPAPERAPEPDLLITESMAELLLQQGYRTEALTVYRHLERRGPGDPRLRQKIDELETATSGPAPDEAEPPAESWSVTVTRGRPVVEFLGGILAARPPTVASGPAMHAGAGSGSAADPDGAPTRPAHDSLSLSSVFGEESNPNPPAVPAAGGAAPGGVSYDEFFGSPGAPPAARPARGPDPKSDDLDQFHAWLQNLKR